MKARVSLGPAAKVNLPIPSGGLSIPGFMIGDVDDVAAQGYQACIKGEVICVPGAINLTATLAGRATPKWLLRRVSGILGRYTSGK